VWKVMHSERKVKEQLWVSNGSLQTRAPASASVEMGSQMGWKRPNILSKSTNSESRSICSTI
jgi:hypothetical protein